MKRVALRLATYRLRGRRALGALVTIVLLVGLLGGVALAALAGARATDDSYPTLLARSNPSALSVTFFGPVSTSALDHLKGVRHVEADDYTINGFPLLASGAPAITGAIGSGDVTPLGSLDGEYFNQDRVSIVAGRMANARNPDEFMATAVAERLMGWHVGERIKFGFYANAQTALKGFGTPAVRPLVVRNELLVGTMVMTSAVVQDAVDLYPTDYLFTPAAASASLRGGTQYVQYNIQLDPRATVAEVENDIINALPPSATYTTTDTSVIEGQVNRSIRPEALALGTFGALALASTLLIGFQLITRELRRRRADHEVMRALGAGRVGLVLDAVLGPIEALVLGGVVALLVAIGLSPFTLLGPVRPLLHEGVSVHAAIVVTGVAVLVVSLAIAAIVLAWWWAPGRRGASGARVLGGSRAAKLGANVGLSASAVAGLHFAFDPGRGRRAAPMRSVLVGLAFAVAMVGTTLTFASGLSSLISHPRLYGWNWSYAVTSDEQVPPASIAVLRHSDLVSAFSGVSFADVQIDGLTEPAMLSAPNQRVGPPILAGHGIEKPHQIVLGAATLAQLHKRIGQSVTVTYGSPKSTIYLAPVRATIVGTATLPAVGRSQTFHPSMGVGAIVDSRLEDPALRKVIVEGEAIPGPDMVFVRLRAGVTLAQGAALMRRVDAAGTKAYAALPDNKGGGDSVVDFGVQYPAEILNYRSIGDTPLWLSLAFALGVAIAFGLTIVTSVRRRRRDLALFKVLGFTRRQVAATVAWQANASVVVGLLIGIPVAILAGRALWELFARQINAVPLATVPTASLALLALGALVLANVVVIVPRRLASSVVAGAALRGE